MTGRQNRATRRHPSHTAEAFVLSLLTVALLGCLLILVDVKAPAAEEEGGGLVVAAIFGVVGLVVAHRTAGPRFVAQSLAEVACFAPVAAWAILFAVEGTGADAKMRLIAATIAFWGAAAALAWKARLWPFETRAERDERHPVAVVHADPPEKDYQPYFIALCDCGWMGDFHDVAEPAFADAHRHSSNVDPDVRRPLDGPEQR